MNIIIFSKNRPAQLELLLRSMKKYFKEYDQETVKVLYKYDWEYKKGYKKVYQLYPKTYFIEETIDFKHHLLDLIDKKEKYTLFFCDDDVFIRPFSIQNKQFKQLRINPDILNINLRMSQNYNYCWDCDGYMAIPEFIDDMWQWRDYTIDWGFAMGCVGFVYRTSQIKELLKTLKFNGPNMMEAGLASHPLQQPLMVGYKKARTVNIPLNLVQDVALQNRHINLSTENLNKQFMQGKIISLNNILRQTHNFNSCFMPIKPKWVKGE